PGIAALLAAWLLKKKVEDHEISVRGPQSTISYLTRMKFFEILELPNPMNLRERSETGRFMTLRIVCSANDETPTKDEICDLVLRKFDESEELIAVTEFISTELLDNVSTHAKIMSPGVACAQYYPSLQEIEVGI